MVALIAAFVSACDSGLLFPNQADNTQREPREQTFGPNYPAQPPAGRAVWFDSATLDAARRTLTITFVGGKGYLAADPCSEDYVPWLAPRGGQLDVKIVNVERPDRVPPAPNTGCTLEGYGHTYHLRLPVAFAGDRVTDLANGTIFEVGNP